MRTLLQLTLNSGTPNDQPIRDWLDLAGFRPQNVGLDNESRQLLLRNDRPDAVPEIVLDLSNRHAFEILSTIPRAEQEREYAVNFAKYIIRFDDQHGNTVWGLVCIDSPTVFIRWRHRVSRGLERATEELVSRTWEQCGDNKLFKTFSSPHIVPVREPHSTSDAYIGEILPPGTGLKDRAKKDKKMELRIFAIMVVATVVFFGLGLYLFLVVQDPNHPLRWVSGFFDRLATTAAVTAAISYLQFFFHLRDLQLKPIIDWK